MRMFSMKRANFLIFSQIIESTTNLHFTLEKGNLYPSRKSFIPIRLRIGRAVFFATSGNPAACCRTSPFHFFCYPISMDATCEDNSIENLFLFLVSNLQSFDEEPAIPPNGTFVWTPILQMYAEQSLRPFPSIYVSSNIKHLLVWQIIHTGMIPNIPSEASAYQRMAFNQQQQSIVMSFSFVNRVYSSFFAQSF